MINDDTSAPRVIVVDDSAASRALLAEVLEECGCKVVGRAMDGAMALRLVADLKPDAITCDLEMPGMDGFTFLRLLSKNFPTPVIMVTSNRNPAAALQSLELGARDFVVKPNKSASGMREIGADVANKILAFQHAQSASSFEEPPKTPPRSTPLASLVVIGASTGGPRAIRSIMSALGANKHPPIVIAQHMPEGFTEAFADRLAATTGRDVAEASNGEELTNGMVRIAPGGKHLEVFLERGRFYTRLLAASGTERHVPSVDQLFKSAAVAAKHQCLGIVLTGMGRDGAEGASAFLRVGAPLWIEAPATATIGGMPQAALAEYPNAHALALDEIGEELRAMFASGKRKS